MIVRAIDDLKDWQFGKGLNDYRSQNDAIAQNIETRLKSFLGDCFFDQAAGIDWFGFLGGKNQLGLSLSIQSTILNTDGVISLLELNTDLDAQRQLTISYSVQTSYSTVSGAVEQVIQ